MRNKTISPQRIESRTKEYYSNKEKSFFDSQNKLIQNENLEISKLSFEPKTNRSSNSRRRSIKDLEIWEIKRKKKLIILRDKQLKSSIERNNKSKILKKSKEIYYKTNPFSNLKVEDRLILSQKIKDEKLKELSKIRKKSIRESLSRRSNSRKQSDSFQYEYEKKCIHDYKNDLHINEIIDEKLVNMYHQAQIFDEHKQKIKKKKNIDYVKLAVEKRLFKIKGKIDRSCEKEGRNREKTLKKKERRGKHDRRIKKKKTVKKVEKQIREKSNKEKLNKSHEKTIKKENKIESKNYEIEISKRLEFDVEEQKMENYNIKNRDEKTLIKFPKIEQQLDEEALIKSSTGSSNRKTQKSPEDERLNMIKTDNLEFQNDHSDFIELSSFDYETKDPHLRMISEFGERHEQTVDYGIECILPKKNNLFSKKKPSLGYEDAKNHLNRIKELLHFDFKNDIFERKEKRKNQRRKNLNNEEGFVKGETGCQE